jgi:hypothetical protein
VRKILLFGSPAIAKLEMSNFDRSLFPSSEEAAAMQKWIERDGEPNDTQLFGETNTLDLVGDEKNGIYGLASYYTRLTGGSPEAPSEIKFPEVAVSPISKAETKLPMFAVPTTPQAQLLRVLQTPQPIQNTPIREVPIQERIERFRQTRKDRNFIDNQGIQILLSGSTGAAPLYVSIRDAHISTLIRKGIPDITDDTKDWNLHRLNMKEIENKFNTVSFIGMELPLNAASYQSLVFIVEYMKHWKGNDSGISNSGKWESDFLGRIAGEKELDNVIVTAEYLGISSLANLCRIYTVNHL